MFMHLSSYTQKKKVKYTIKYKCSLLKKKYFTFELSI